MKKKEKHNFALIVEKQSGETKMSEGELKKQLYECLQFGHEFTMEEVYKIVDEARKEFYIALAECRRLGGQKELIEFGLKWLGAKSP